MVERTPVLVVAGQELTDEVCERLLRDSGTIVVTHRYDGQVVVRSVRIRSGDEPHTSEWPLELANCCVDCTIRDDLLILLRRLHRRDDVSRIVVHLAPWLEPEPVCWAINNVDVHVGPGYVDGPAARDVAIQAVVSTVATSQWLIDALSADELDDDRTVAQVVVGQAEFADVLVLSEREYRTHAVLRRLTPRASIVVGVGLLPATLDAMKSNPRRDHDYDPHAPLLAGEPPLAADGDVQIIEFEANRPFHPMRLHLAIDELLDGVVRIKGRVWLASQPDTVVWIESAGGGLRVGDAGRWLAGSSPDEQREADPDRVALASLRWDEEFGDRHVSLTALVCGADPDRITRVLSGALLTDEELSHPEAWTDYDDPFGEWHEDPCDGLDKVEDACAPERPDGEDFAGR
ncbi:ribosome hibernation factor-recruiting GTPase MRF [Mycobacterium spongiae]|uniref:ribosome hibernation factor-recruiting GTPase MRF n=1 Tax=Mycobacterium spongiae TaxID=886343 RepID=UPI001FE737C8|nr:GTP-binding protein [Mycobacterium spongiae]